VSIAAVVNLNARSGSHAVVRDLRALLPGARIEATANAAEADRVLDALAAAPPRVLLSGGGDGTAAGLITGLRARDVALPALGILPLGTGNGWARATGIRRVRESLRQLASLGDVAPPMLEFDLVETEGRLAPFAGTGWDAEIISDYHKRRAAMPEAVRARVGGGTGYLASLFTRTIPRHLVGDGPPRVRLVNTGAPALQLVEGGRIVPVAGGEAGAVLYEGPMGVAGASTVEELGLGFRAFPHARDIPGRICARVYGASTLEATLRLRQLWRGVHPLPKSVIFFVTACRWEFEREVPFEVAGDLLGDRRTLEMRAAHSRVPLVDWGALRARH
jgi:hypothetical protein